MIYKNRKHKMYFKIKFTFAIVVSTKNYEYIFEERYKCQGPKYKGKNTINLFICLRMCYIFSKCTLVDIQGRNTQIAVNYSKALIC